MGTNCFQVEIFFSREVGGGGWIGFTKARGDYCLMSFSDTQGTDKSYIHKQHEAFEGHPCYVKGDRRLWEQEFGIHHYAGLVTYTVQGFLDKNKDTQQDQLFELMHGSTNVFVQDLTRFQVPLLR